MGHYIEGLHLSLLETKEISCKLPPLSPFLSLMEFTELEGKFLNHSQAVAFKDVRIQVMLEVTLMLLKK